MLQESYHAEVLLQICSAVLGPNCLVLQERQIGESQLPHGILDLIAGTMSKEDHSYSVGVAIDRNIEVLQDPVAVEAKTTKTMRMEAIMS